MRRLCVMKGGVSLAACVAAKCLRFPVSRRMRHCKTYAAVYIHAIGLGVTISMCVGAQAAAPRAGAPGQPGRMRVGVRAPVTSPTLLLSPADWRFETMPLPPRFAPDMKFAGFEEIRFAPGMFDTTSPNYFTYVLALSVNGTEKVEAADLKDFLEKYYRGLLGGLGQRKGLPVDPSKIHAEIAPAQAGDKNPNRFQGKVAIVDTFTDGRNTSVNVEADVLPQPALNKTYVVLLLSPQPQDSEVWKNLRAIRDKIRPERFQSAKGQSLNDSIRRRMSQ